MAMPRKPHLPANLTPILKSVRHEVKAYATMTIGLLMYAFGWITLLIPAKIVGGGVSGIGTLIFYATAAADGTGGVPVGVTYAVVNAYGYGRRKTRRKQPERVVQCRSNLCWNGIEPFPERGN